MFIKRPSQKQLLTGPRFRQARIENKIIPGNVYSCIEAVSDPAYFMLETGGQSGGQEKLKRIAEVAHLQVKVGVLQLLAEYYIEV